MIPSLTLITDLLTLLRDACPGGSLVDQLKAYGGPGAVIREDNSLKNPFKTR